MLRPGLTPEAIEAILASNAKGPKAQIARWRRRDPTLQGKSDRDVLEAVARRPQERLHARAIAARDSGRGEG